MKKKSPEFSLDVNAVLDRLLDARDIPAGWGRDTTLAKHLDILPKRVSAWRERNTIDHALVAFRSREWGLSLSWVFFGDGPRQVLPTPTPADPMTAMREILATLAKQVRDLEQRYPMESGTGDEESAEETVVEEGSAEKTSADERSVDAAPKQRKPTGAKRKKS